jgi:hypothetical protein
MTNMKRVISTLAEIYGSTHTMLGSFVSFDEVFSLYTFARGDRITGCEQQKGGSFWTVLQKFLVYLLRLIIKL